VPIRDYIRENKGMQGEQEDFQKKKNAPQDVV
jgi:hypothetical protein